MAQEPGVKVALVAGEASGDMLGGSLLQALRARAPGLSAMGVAGEEMRAAGCRPLVDASELAVMGLVEVIAHLPRLLKLRRQLARQFATWRPDVFVGIDAPEFNLGLESRLRRQGIPTVQYVSPSVWAWRGGRVRKIARSADLVLCLLPFEKQFYDDHNIRAVFVGHPLAERITRQPDTSTARRELGLADDGEWLALLPGSRIGEVTRLANDFAETIAWLRERRPSMRFVAALASAECETIFRAALRRITPPVGIHMIRGRSHEVMAAADVLLVASGTATLEAALIGRPMVVTYRLAQATQWLLKWPGLLKIDRFALPNLVAGEDLVPEIINDDVSVEALGQAILRELDDTGRRQYLDGRFRDIRQMLKHNAAERAAAAILDLAAGRSGE
ncbi:MAG: lipid-A-disaccharide synthase [Proteobacteria bacterium]|nr:lipid-A-disaccharide synthase [Pseudomonadota bacterium]